MSKTPKPATPADSPSHHSTHLRQSGTSRSTPALTTEDLRQQAEKIFRKKGNLPSEGPGKLPPDETRRILHELQVHQIELELQNEELRRVQLELETTRTRYFDLYELAPVGYCTISSKGQILEANITAATLLDADKSLLAKKPLTAFIAPDDQTTCYLQLKKLFDTGQPQSFELRTARKDETVFWLQLTANLAQGQGGEPVCRLTLNDISRLKQAEEELRNSSEVRFQKLLREVQSVAVQGYRPDGTTLYWNQASETLYGYSAQEAIGRNLLELIIPPGMREDFSQAIEQMLQTGQPVPPAELTLMRKDGSAVTVFSSHALLQLPGQAPELYCIDIDLSDRKMAEEALRESEERYRQLFESASDAIFLISPDSCQIIDANKKASELYGYTHEELLTKTSRDISAEPEQAYQRTLETQTIHDHDTRLHRKKDGTVLPVEITTQAVVLKEKPAMLVAVLDTTERRQAEEEKTKLEALNWQLQKRESLRRMAGAIAHHFNNRLGVVIGNLEMAIDDLPRGVGPAYSLATALQAAKKAAEVSGLLLTYLGQTTGHCEPLDLAETCRTTLPLLLAATPKTINFQVDLPTPGPTVSANANQIQQILNNLVTNAWEASNGRKGIIGLKVTTVAPAEIPDEHRFPIGWQPGECLYACIEIKDSGCGIADEDIHKLFDPFFSNKFTGRGLGLSVVLGVVKAHDGAVSVESEPGKGSIFSVFLPLSDMEVLNRRILETPPKPSWAERERTVLLVDDEDTMREMATAMLTRLGYRALSARNGSEAVEIYQQKKDEIHCVVCDLTMPEMDGYETFILLKQIAPEVKVILSSGYSREQVIELFEGRGLAGFLQKPYSQAEMAAIVLQVLENRERQGLKVF